MVYQYITGRGWYVNPYWHGYKPLTMYWFQTKLYTLVLVNVTKRMKKSPILRCMLLHQYLTKKIIIPLYPAPIQLCIGLINPPPMFTDKRAPPFFQFCFWFGFNPPIFLNLVRTLTFSIFLGVPSKTTRQNLIYYYL